MRVKAVSLIGLLQAAAVATMLFSVVTVFDAAHRNIELFSHFRLQYLAVSVLLLIVFALLRSPAYAVALLATAVLNASYVMPWYGSGTLAAGNANLRLVHANIYSRNNEYERFFEFIETEQPDVIFLQEVTPAWNVACERLRDNYPFAYSVPREGNFGIAMFSRIALDSVTHVDSPPLQYPTILATMTVGGVPLTLINTHPTIPLTRSLYDARNEHFESVADIAMRTQGAVVLTGDFNSSVWSRPYRMLEQSTGLRNTRRGFGIQPTWPTFMPFAMIPLDHALVSDDISVVGTRTGAHIGSDHLPLIVELAVGGQPVNQLTRAAGKP